MNRRRFLELLGLATAGSVVAYSFPSIIVPKNIEVVPALTPEALALAGQSALRTTLLTFYFNELINAQTWFEKSRYFRPDLPDHGTRLYFSQSK